MKVTSSVCPLFLIFSLLSIVTLVGSGCANMIPPGGGPRDSLPPVLVEALPKDSSTNFAGNRIVLNFDEFVDIQNAFENVLVSPNPVSIPIITSRFRTVNIRLKDTLEANTTYSINFGNALRDINEGNVATNFTYVFSTGNKIDTNTISGNVILAETGKLDTTLLVVLHRNIDDSAVVKERPRYVAKQDGKGNFQFRNIASGTFALYALPNDYSKRYDDTTKPFAFADSVINSTQNKPVTLYAYQLPKIDTAVVKPKASATNTKTKEDKVLRLQPNFDNGKQSLLKNLELTFNKIIRSFDSTKVMLLGPDSSVIKNFKVVADTNNTRYKVLYNWIENTQYTLIVQKDAFTDTAGVTLLRNDTLRFSSKRISDYGSVRLRFKNLDLSRNPVLQVVQSDRVIDSIPLSRAEWTQKMMEPAEYDLRILYDSNKNGKWDPGRFFGLHKQPEIVEMLEQKLSVRANTDNDKEIVL